jgi:hypothetical protein
LKSGRVGGVALDVYEEEEGVFFEDLSGQILHDDELARLLTFPNVLITAHQAFLTQEALGEIARVNRDEPRAFAKGQPFLPRRRSRDFSPVDHDRRSRATPGQTCFCWKRETTLCRLRYSTMSLRAPNGRRRPAAVSLNPQIEHGAAAGADANQPASTVRSRRPSRPTDVSPSLPSFAPPDVGRTPRR